MRLAVAAFLAFAALVLPQPQPAHAVESVILDAFKQMFSGEPESGNLPRLRKQAEAGAADAQYLIYQYYLLMPRQGVGVRVASETLASRAEAEAGLRAAAGQGHSDAIFELGRALYEGGPVRRDRAEARTWLEKVPASSEHRPQAASMLGEILLFSDGATDAEKAEGLTLLEEALAGGNLLAIRGKARALREGVGVAADPAAARRMLEEALAAGNDAAYAPLGEMVLKGEGGPQDVKRGMALLDAPMQNPDMLGRAILADVYLANEFVGRQPRKAILLMAPYAAKDVATRQKLAPLLVDYEERVGNADLLNLRYQEDEDAGEPDGAWLLLQLAKDGPSPYLNSDLTYEIMDRDAATDERIALADAEKLAIFSIRDGQYSDDFARQARTRIDALAEKGLAAAWTLKGRLLRDGHAYQQDDVAATEAFQKAAELGDLAGMVELADAYDDGLGIPEDDALYVRWLREAAHRGSIDAREDLAWQFHFDSFDRRLTLREGVTEIVVLYGNDLGMVDASEFSSLLSNSRLADFGEDEIVAALMDGFRAAPAALEEQRLVAMMKQLPQETRAGIEAALKAEGFYSGTTEGYFRPDARAALVAWVEAKGPLPDAEAPADDKPPQGIAYPEIPADVVKVALDNAFAKVETAQSDDEWRETLAMLAPLARLGEPISRWVLLRWYDQSPLIGEAVTPEEITRFGLDMLLLADPNMEAREMEFNFTIVELWKAGQGKQFTDGFLAVLRDDERLRNPNALDDVLHQIFFIPGGCDMLLAGAREAGVEGLTEEDCNNRETREALLAYAEKAGPSGVEAESRAAAVAEVYKVAGMPQP